MIPAELDALVAEVARLTTKCKYGDPLCPCQDGDACHYEGDNPMTPPPIAALKSRIAALEAERDALKAERADIIKINNGWAHEWDAMREERDGMLAVIAAAASRRCVQTSHT